ncbi:hypothetical protein HYC85_026682 [Camellia sinensis]|uniref:RRM domain-containing protein n=1 Tax=Camellia sinensis TaxID=4442 RepID=A0A7J7G486_CAMSI|nr:hypothetical protein HYC85_026682 [Camellia sinensis]
MLDIQYVKNLDLDVTEELLTEKFSKFGKILSLIVSKDEYGASRGFGFVFGFVCFSTPEEANKAVNNFHVYATVDNGIDSLKEPKQELYQVDENDEELPDFYKFYEKSHKTNDWIDSRCGDLHNMNIHATN